MYIRERDIYDNVPESPSSPTVRLRSDILVLAIFSRRRGAARRIGAPSGNIKGAITLESGKTKRAAANAAARDASRREREKEQAEERRGRRWRERERYTLRERERASRWIARPFVERRRAAAFTSSEPFPSTFQIMRERNPRFVYPVPCPRIRVGSYHATRRARESSLSLTLPPSLSHRAANM